MIAERAEGTCDWFLGHQDFRSWENSGPGLMLTTADPGCGKSVLARRLVDHELVSDDSRTTCYFFFRENYKAQKSIIHAFYALLHQLFSLKPSLINHAMTAYRGQGDRLPTSLEALWKILTAAATDPAAGEVVVVLDALDECEEVGRRQIMQALENDQLKILITSGPSMDINRGISKPKHRIHGEDNPNSIAQEIDMFVHSSVPVLAARLKLNSAEQTLLTNKLLGVPDRTYLWVSCVLTLIRNEVEDPNEKVLAEIIDSLPEDLVAVYERIMKKARNHDNTRKLLCLMVAALRPLALDELNIAFNIKDKHKCNKELKDDLSNQDRFNDTIRYLTGLFVSEFNSKVFLLHQTGRKFLLERSARDSWYRFDELEAERIMLRSCMRYLMLSDFDTDMTVENDELYSQESNDSGDELSLELEPGYKQAMALAMTGLDGRWKQHNLPSYELKSFDKANVRCYRFFKYAACHWVMHFRNLQASNDRALRKDVLELYVGKHRFENWSRLNMGLVDICPRPILPNALIAAAIFGHETIAKHIFQHEDVDIDAVTEDIARRTALSWAAERGRKAVVALLLDWRASESAASLVLRVTPLLYACREGHVEVVQLLVRNKSQIDQPTKVMITDPGMEKAFGGEFPLSTSADRGHFDIVRLLLEAGADLNKTNESRITPLMLAVASGHNTIAKLLIDAGADVNVKDKDGKDVMFYALRSRNTDLIRLIENSGNKGKPKSRVRPATGAAHGGIESDIETLMDADTARSALTVSRSLSLLTKRFRSEVLEKAFKMPPVFKIKSDYSPEDRERMRAYGKFNFRNSEGETPLFFVAEAGLLECVRALWSLKVHVNVKRKDGQTPLFAAVRGGHVEVVKLLLRFKADPWDEDEEGQTPICEARGCGHKEIGKLLDTEMRKGKNWTQERFEG